MANPKVDRDFSLAFTAPVPQGAAALDSVKSAYNALAQAFNNAGREPALIEVRAWAAPKDKP